MAKRRTSAVGSGNRSAGGGHGVSKATSNRNTAKTKQKPLVPGAGVAKSVAHTVGQNPIVKTTAAAASLGVHHLERATNTVLGKKTGPTPSKAMKTQTSKNTPPSTTTKSTPQTAFARPNGPTSATVKRAPTKTTSAKTYTVKAGDNLWNISKKQFGGTSNSDISASTKSLWDKNKGVVGKGGSIKPGDTLTF